jgi:hypothetical protein
MHQQEQHVMPRFLMDCRMVKVQSASQQREWWEL